jgi:hypothetical protein
MSPNGLCRQTACVTNRWVSLNGLCHQTACATTRPVSPNGPYHQARCITNRLVLPNGMCHPSILATKRDVWADRPYHQTVHLACITRRPVSPTACVTKRKGPESPNGRCHQTTFSPNENVSPKTGLYHQPACVTKQAVSPDGSCHQTACRRTVGLCHQRPVSPNGPCHPAGCFTNRLVSPKRLVAPKNLFHEAIFLLPNGMCHPSILATKRDVWTDRPCHRTVHIARFNRRPASPDGLCHQTACVI